MAKKEKWMPVKGFEGYYIISNYGVLMSLDRAITRSDGMVLNCKGKALNPSITKDGYLRTMLSKPGKSKSYLIHRLVAESFIPNPKNKRTVNHKNGIKSDNKAINLEWATDRENIKHSFDVLGRKGTNLGRFGDMHSNSIRVTQMKNGEVVGSYGSIREASRKTGIHRSTILNAFRSSHGKAAGYFWKKESK